MIPVYPPPLLRSKQYTVKCNSVSIFLILNFPFERFVRIIQVGPECCFRSKWLFWAWYTQDNWTKQDHIGEIFSTLFVNHRFLTQVKKCWRLKWQIINTFYWNYILNLKSCFVNFIMQCYSKTLKFSSMRNSL